MQNPEKQLTIYTEVNEVNDMLKLRHVLKPLLNQGLYAQARPRLKYLQWELVGRCSSLRGNYFPCVFEYSSKCCWLYWGALFCFPAELPCSHTGAVAQLEVD